MIHSWGDAVGQTVVLFRIKTLGDASRFMNPLPISLLPSGFNLAGLSRRAVFALAGSLRDTQHPTSILLPRFEVRRGRRGGGRPYSRVTAVPHVGDAACLIGTRTRAGEGPRAPAFGVPGERRCPAKMTVCHHEKHVVLCRRCRGCAAEGRSYRSHGFPKTPILFSSNFCISIFSVFFHCVSIAIE